MTGKREIAKMQKTLDTMTKAVKLMNLTTRLMNAFVKQVDREEAKRRREGGKR